MPEFIAPYAPLLQALAALALLMLVQTLVADLAGMRAKHVPGMPVTSGHSDFFFRATRTLANTNENIGAFLVALLAAVWLGASPAWVNGLAWAFVAARAAYLVCYYADWRWPRSIVFGAGVAAQAGLVLVVARAAFF